MARTIWRLPARASMAALIAKAAFGATGSGVLVVLYSQDLEATLSATKNAGAMISKETFSFPGGRRFHFIDPNGVELAVWSE